MTSSTEKNKVLVLGDSGVGKSSLVHLICHGKPIVSASWTIGASIEVKRHEYAEGTPGHKSSCIELWDIGGSKNHYVARRILYNNFHGIILVHDVTNRKSHDNLRKWLSEVFSSELSKEPPVGFCYWLASIFFGAPASYEGIDFDPEALTRRRIPVLVVGTKSDCTNMNAFKSRSLIAQECSAEEIFVDCTNDRSLAPATTNAVELSKFFDRVVSRRETYNAYYTDNAIPSSVIVDRSSRNRNYILSSLSTSNSVATDNIAMNRYTNSLLYSKSVKYSRVD